RRGCFGNLLHVEDLLERVDVRIDEQAAIDFERRIGSEVERFALVLLGARHLVSDAVLREKPLNQCCFLSSTSREKPYGHPPLPHSRPVFASILDEYQTVSLFRTNVK